MYARTAMLVLAVLRDGLCPGLDNVSRLYPMRRTDSSQAGSFGIPKFAITSPRQAYLTPDLLERGRRPSCSYVTGRWSIAEVVALVASRISKGQLDMDVNVKENKAE